MQEAKLIKKAKKGHHASFIQLMKDHESSMYRVAKGILKKDHDCADAIQETILICFRKISSLKEEKHFKTWLIRILIHECYRLLEKRKTVIPFEAPWIESEKEEIELKMAVQEAVSSLNDELRIVTMLYYFEDLAIKEISDILQIPEGTVKSRLSTARRHLMTLLKEENPLFKRSGRK
ncbi:sigma-70 family RNA polymerase sigma factor [Bacillus salacetis]|uniref:Sigma-70 family RNA polymerase sigma factor n=1 Tax=Bacillus salacetis TaxID=2315464 RepID=A0A3A1R0U9_9BACI|nr:sigma-70 family RNA polymerase sigma factor [Bacillus salacetis]RIW31987.1 sigma-70 family RNA polymerase sigma factor [Bacillus salacetis]